MIEEADLNRLREAAVTARSRAYAPYSGFRVGAVLLDGYGMLHLGCNVENASYGLGVCAERHAIAAAVMATFQELRALFVLTDAARPTTPCGACRQVLAEHAPASLPVRCETVGGGVLEATLGQLLPHGFSRDSLG